ncbi:MAG: hypothetical protein ACE5HZ_03825 [Fidelibacterota bacterium]
MKYDKSSPTLPVFRENLVFAGFTGAVVGLMITFAGYDPSSWHRRTGGGDFSIASDSSLRVFLRVYPGAIFPDESTEI